VNKGFTKRINGVTRDESDLLLPFLINLVTQNHDAQVRFKWRKNDLAIEAPGIVPRMITMQLELEIVCVLWAKHRTWI
jgi:hypothetical protein